MVKIFISHRRTDTSDFAAKLIIRLRNVFGEESVILDDYVIRGNHGFRHKLVQDITTSDVVIILVGENWLAKQPNGVPWVFRDDSWTLFELKIAWLFEKAIMPILVESSYGYTISGSEPNVPQEIKMLDNRQHTVVSNDGSDWNRIFENLRPLYENANRIKSLPNRSAFISYRRVTSKKFAKAIYDFLNNNKIQVFIDLEDMPTGKWNESLKKQIMRHNFFILILAQETLESPVVMEEIQFAYYHKDPSQIIVITHGEFSFYDAVIPEKVSFIRDLHAVQFSTLSLYKNLHTLQKYLNMDSYKKVHNLQYLIRLLIHL